MSEIKQKLVMPRRALPWLLVSSFVLIVVVCVLYFMFDGTRYFYALKMTQIRMIKQNRIMNKDFFDKFDNSIIEEAKRLPVRTVQEVSSHYRVLIYENTTKAFDKKYWDDISVMYSMMDDYFNNKGPKPSLKCDSRAYFMRNILFNIGIETRLVHGLCLNDDGSFSGHTFLEVLDSDNNFWVVHDPYFNMSYINKKTGLSAGLLDLCLFDIDEFTPTADSLAVVFNDKRQYFSRIYTIAIYDNRELGTQSVIVFNKRKLGITTMADFFQEEKFSALRDYISGIWCDYAWIDI